MKRLVVGAEYLHEPAALVGEDVEFTDPGALYHGNPHSQD